MDNFYLPTRSLYTTPQQVKALLSTNNNTLGQVIAGVQDDLILYLCEAASQKIDEYCAPRFFYPFYKTSVYNWPGTSFELNFRDDLLFLDALINGDGSTIPPTTTISGQTLTSYFFYPPDILPKNKVQLNIASGYVFLFIGTPQQAIRMKGMYGYPANEVLGLWKVGSTTVQDNPQLDTSTTLTVPSGALQTGQTVYIETELELVQNVAQGNGTDTCTVVRGHNGTTAATHLQGTSVYRVLVHPVVSRAAVRLVSWYFRQKDAADFGKIQLSASSFGMIELPAEIPVDIAGDLMPLVRQHF